MSGSLQLIRPSMILSLLDQGHPVLIRRAASEGLGNSFCQGVSLVSFWAGAGLGLVAGNEA